MNRADPADRGADAPVKSLPQTEPVIVPRPDHNISRADMSRNAVKVLYRLKEAGYQAFLVGGSVRDLLLGVLPKDFDIATDAHPEEVAGLFRNCRLIGRRFRLAHVRFGREIIEVATFRGRGEGEPETDLRVQDEGGRILRDNIYGSIHEDVWRRDFTANALYYNIADFSIWDYTGGVEDVRNRRLRLLGDPETRYREDPVRMLRAVRFAAKLDFDIAPDTARPIAALAPLISEVPPARLFEEVLKLFHGGFAQVTFDKLREYGLLGQLFPTAEQAFAGPHGDQLVALARLAMVNTDARIADERPVNPMFLFAVLLWGPIRDRAAALLAEEGGSEAQALAEAASEVIFEQQAFIAVPRRFSGPLREMLALQPRFLQMRGRRAKRLLEHKRFRAAYDFLLLRAETGEADPAVAEFWTRLQTESPERQAESLDAPAADDAPDEAADETADAAPAAKPRRRRRRRRRRGAGSGSGGQD